MTTESSHAYSVFIRRLRQKCQKEDIPDRLVKHKEKIFMTEITYKDRKNLWKKILLKLQIAAITPVVITGCGFAPETAATMNDGSDTDVSADIDMQKQDEQGEAKDTTEEKQAENTETDYNADSDNNIYNSVKYDRGYFYFSDLNGMQRVSEDLLATESLTDGNIVLGNCDGDNIYYVRYASDDAENAGIFRMNLTNLEEEKLLDWTESMWGVRWICIDQNTMYLECGDMCKAYAIDGGAVSEKEDEDNLVYKALDRCGILREDMSALAYGYTDMMFRYHKAVCCDGQNNKIIVYDTDSGEIINLIEQCMSDVLVSEEGIVYKDLNNNILFREWEEKDSRMLYDVSENDNISVNYGTFDDQYIYAFRENENECTLIKISWEGECETGRKFENVTRAFELGFSINDGVTSFLQDGCRIFER